jgi:hypothetical protein
MKKKSCDLGLLILLAITCVQAQSVPVTSKMLLVPEIIVNGKVVETHRQEGIFYRASTGAELRRWLKEDGKEAVGEMASGALKNERGVIYKVDYQRRTVYEVPPISVDPPHSGRPPTCDVSTSDSR